jgi:integrase
VPRNMAAMGSRPQRASGGSSTETRRAEAAKDVTIQREFSMLKKSFSLAIRAKRLAVRPPFPELKVGNLNARAGFLEGDQFEAIMRHLPPDEADMVLFARTYGWRWGECAGLQWRQVNLKDHTVRLDPDQSKNREGRLAIFSAPNRADARAMFERRHAAERAAGRIATYVFTLAGRPFSYDTFNRRWKAACEAAGCAGKLFHDLRRSCVRDMLRAGAREREVMLTTGHKTRAIFDRYRILSEAELAEAQGKTAAFEKEHKTSTNLT